MGRNYRKKPHTQPQQPEKSTKEEHKEMREDMKLLEKDSKWIGMVNIVLAILALMIITTFDLLYNPIAYLVAFAIILVVDLVWRRLRFHKKQGEEDD